MPRPCKPTAFTMPLADGCKRGAGLPDHANGAWLFVVTAPSCDGSHSRATSSPCPNVPDAATIGFGSTNEPIRTSVSTVSTAREPSRLILGRVRTVCVDWRRTKGRGATSDLQAELAVVVVLLQRADPRRVRGALRDAGGRRQRRGDRRDARHLVASGGAADVVAVGARATTTRRVD